MMHGREKSDPVIVAGKPTNKAERSAAELVEPRTGTKGNADGQSTHWTQSQARVSQALGRIRQAVAVTHPRWEPHAGKPHVRICAGGASQLASLPLNRREFITGIGGAASILGSFAARAHGQGRPFQIAFLSATSKSANERNRDAFVGRLQQLSRASGRDYIIIERYADGIAGRVPPLAEELVGLKPDLILAGTSQVARVT